MKEQPHTPVWMASADRDRLEDVRCRALAVLERVRFASKYRLRSKVEEIEASVAIDTLAEVEAILKRRGRWFVAKRRFLLKLRYLR
jgi:hypothetical protein